MMGIVLYIFVHKGGIGALPGRDTSTAVAQCHETGLNPRSAKAVEEVSLASDFVLVEVGIAKLSNVDLRFVSVLRRETAT
jgi:hypothetical protein